MSHEVRRNFIIKRHFNSYCLLCDDCFKAEEESIRQHIQCDPHRNAFISKMYFENYKDDGIKQFKRGYYCEICDVLLQTRKKISLHVLESAHIHLKAMNSLKQVQNGVTAFDCLLIEDDAWHGFVDSTCVICNIDITDKSVHKKDSFHIFLMIQTKLEFQDSNIFRKMGNDYINCLICNDILSVDIFSKHLKSESHLSQHVKCKQNYEMIIMNPTPDGANPKITNENVAIDAKAEYESKEDNEKASMKIKKSSLEKNKIKDSQGDENKVDEKGVQKQITSEPKRAVDKKTIGNIRKSEDSNVIKVDTRNKCNKSIDASNEFTSEEFKLCEPLEAFGLAQELAKENKLKYKHGKNSAYCTVCNVTISSSLKRMKDHVSEEKHKENLTKVLPVDKIPFGKFVTSILEVKFRTLDVFVILNKKFCITQNSYLLITRNEYTERCQLCDTTDNLYPLDLHENTWLHQYLSTKLSVICSIEQEFIRQITDKNLFHCGFCNMVASWDEMLQHLKSTSHNETRLKAFFVLCTIIDHEITG